MIQVVNLGEVNNAQAAEWLVDLSEDLRKTDLDEIAAHTGDDPSVALITSVMVSDHAWVILDGEDPIAAFGCAPTDDPKAAQVWMLGSDRMDEPANAVGILRLSKSYMDAMQVTYEVLYNYIDCRNDRSMRWLRWCGYEVFETVPEFGVGKLPFSRFARHRPHV
jgi:hypothetical protein